MKTDEILNLDYRKEENKVIIQKVLRKIKPLSKFSEENDIPIEAIEKAIRVMVCKYEITPQWMHITYENPILCVYSIGVKTSDTHKWLGDVFGMCLYEVFAKLAIKIYSEIKSGNIPVKSLTKEEKQRERIAKKVDSEKEDSD